MKDISISSTTIFSYNLGCGDESPEFVVSPEGKGWVRVNVTGNSFTVNIDPYDGEGIRTADVKIRFGDTVCSGGIKVRQEGSGGGGEPTECTTWKEQVWAKWNGYQYDSDSLIDEVESCRGEVQLELNGHYRCENPSPSNYTNYSPRTIWEVVQGGAYAHLSSTESSAVTVFIDENNDDARQVELAFSGFCYHDDSELATPAYPTGNRVIIRQAAGPCEEQDTCSCESITVTPISNKLSNEGKNGVQLANIEIHDPDCTGRFLLSSSDFISNVRIDGTSIVGNVSENTTDSERTATISVEFDTRTCSSFTVTQEGRDEPEHQNIFEINFGGLEQGFNNTDVDREYTVTVSSATYVNESYVWRNVSLSFNKFSDNLQVTTGRTVGYETPFTIKLKGDLPERNISDIRLTVEPNPMADYEQAAEKTFNYTYEGGGEVIPDRTYMVTLHYYKDAYYYPDDVDSYGYYLPYGYFLSQQYFNDEQMEGNGTYYFCNKLQCGDNLDFIDFNDILLGKKKSNTHTFDDTLWAFSEVIKNLKLKGVPSELIYDTVRSVLDSMNNEHDNGFTYKK